MDPSQYPSQAVSDMPEYEYRGPVSDAQKRILTIWNNYSDRPPASPHASVTNQIGLQAARRPSHYSNGVQNTKSSPAVNNGAKNDNTSARYRSELELQTGNGEGIVKPSGKTQEVEYTSNLVEDTGPLMINRIRRVLSPPPDYKLQPRSSISPTHSAVYIQECEAAAIASRLPPNHMSVQETSVMRQHLSHLQVTSYVVMRNAILRLWVKNPLIWVSREEAQGVAREERHFPLCREIWEFLMRRGYINYGCLDIPEVPITSRDTRQILILGAGVAGLAAARQLQALFAAFHDRLEYDYKVKIVEARSRIGGRVYSHDLSGSSNYPHSRVDLGAQIVTGFKGGNPLNTILQRQLSQPCHSLVQARNNKIHGLDGQPISTEQDLRVEGLFNLLLDVAAQLRDRNLSDSAPASGQKQRTHESASNEQIADTSVVASNAQSGDIDPIWPQSLASLKALGYQMQEGPSLPTVDASSSLGKTMSNILTAFQQVTTIDEGDRQVLNWHWANMEYACGTNLDNLSLRHWDQDDGNEFRGHHAMVIGGYSKLARGLALAPSPLDIQLNCPVTKITPESVVLQSGATMTASKIVCTLPLGVLKSETLTWSPTLPDWKISASKNLGFGLLNKVVLVYDEQFWSPDVDLVGSLPISHKDGDAARGKFYMFWNCTSHASGRPVLVALMAGDAAMASETMLEAELVHEATAILQGIHKDIKVPQPREYLVTRWGKDPFSLGSYSYIGRNGSGADYEALARPVEDHWFFGGEATCQTHPSTVHGAYLSGLAVANDVLESIIGAQEISADVPLVPVKSRPQTAEDSAVESETRKRKFEAMNDTTLPIRDQLKALQKRRAVVEKEKLDALIVERLGLRPEEPKRVNANPFLVYQKDQWDACRLMADTAQQEKLNDPTAKATKNQIRSCLGRTWRDAPDAEKQKWTDIVKEKKAQHEVNKQEWQAQAKEWDAQYEKLIHEFETDVKPQLVTEEEKSLISDIAAENGS